MIKKIDRKNKFISEFDPKTGFYMRSGIIEDGKDTGKDPFMSSYPELIDIGIMERCLCAKQCKVDCYQKAIDRTGNNMSLDSYVNILDQCKGKVFQIALGGAGDVDTHESFEDIVRITRDYNIVPNFTTSGIAITKEKAAICKKYCGAVAVSEHFSEYTEAALDKLLEAGVKTNIHYVVSNKTIDTAIQRLKNNSFKKGINAVVFLLYKPVGLGKEEYMLRNDDKRVEEFFKLVDKGGFSHKVGFDSCFCSGIINHTKHIHKESLDFCEGGRFSMYIDADRNAMPCSFANQDKEWFISLNDHSVQEAWDSDLFKAFRSTLEKACVNCKDKPSCSGGCPLVNQITLCNREERYGETHED